LESIDNQLFIHNLKIVKVVILFTPRSLVIPKESFASGVSYGMTNADKNRICKSLKINELNRSYQATANPVYGRTAAEWKPNTISEASTPNFTNSSALYGKSKRKFEPLNIAPYKKSIKK
jgi:hypothetical protein